MEQKKNDWVATLFFNSDKSLQELANLGFTVENSDIKDKSYYKLKPEIQQAFVKENGEFNEVEFNNFYNSALELYNDEENKNMEVSIMSNFEYDPDDPLAPVGSKRWDKTVSIVHYANPMRQSRGIKNLNSWGAPTMSMREVGQMNKIFNPETGEFEDKTPNDLSFWDVIGSNLVLASWDEDGTHEEDGRIIQHKKGDLKFNEEGDTYYEYLNGRNIAGKELLHVTDVLTEDGSKWNKYDFFDADGLDKSVGGTIARTVLTIAPSFFGAYVGGAYALAGIALELGKLIPELYNSVEGILGGDSSNNHLSNDIQAWFTKFDYNTTDEGRQRMWNIENIGKMISSSSMQLVQQKMIGKIPALINGNKYSENAIKWGRGLSLSYMAGTSATGTFEAFKEAGTSDFVAGLGSLASMMAMGKLMSSDYFRDIWYKGTPLARGEFKKAIKDAAKEVQKSIDVGTLTTKKGQASFLKRASDTIVKYFEKIQNNDLLASAASEGLEETMEEVSFDFIKGATNALNALGIIGRGTDYDFGFSLESMMSRYFSSAVGGALGGAVFNWHNKAQNFFDGVTNDVAKREGFQELIYLIRNNRTGELKSELERWHKKGKLGSTNLSGVEGEIIQNETGSGIVYSHAKDGESQNDIIFKQISNMIDRVEGVLNEENLKISDIELQMIRQNSEDDLSTLSDDDIRFLWKNKVLDYREEELGKESGLVSGIFQEWNMLSNDIVSTKIQLEEMLKPKESEPKTPSDIDAHIAAVKKSSDYKYLSDKLKKLRERRDAIVKGERHNYYTGQLNFALMPEIAKTFGAIVGKNQFALYKFGKKYDELNDDDRKIADELYAKYSPNEKNAAFRAYDIYYNLTQTFKDDINATSSKLEEYTKLFSGELFGQQISESIDEEIKNRESLIELERKLETPDENKIAKLQNEISNLKLQKIMSMMSRSLSSKGREILDRSQENPQTVDYMNNYVSWLQYLKDHDMFLEENDYEYNIIMNYISDIYEKRLRRIKELESDGIIDSNGSNYISKFESAVNKIKNGDFNGINDLNDLLNLFKDDDPDFNTPAVNDEYIDQEEQINNLFYEYLSPEITFENGSKANLIQITEKISSLRSSIKKSPIYNLLGKILADINPELVNIMDVVLSEIRNISSVKDIEDYLIHNPNVITKLQTILDILPAISALVSHRDIIPGESDGISDASEQVLNKEIVILSQQIQSIINIANANNAQKLIEQDKIKINMRQKFADILTNKDSIVAKKLGAAFGFSVPELVDKIGFDYAEINDENYAEYEAKVIALENEIYTKIWSSGKTPYEILEILLGDDKNDGVFNKEDIKKRVSTKMTKDKTAKVEQYDQFVYLCSIIAFPSSNFYNLYKEKIAGLKLAPLFSQEFAIRSVYGFIQSPDFLNAVLNKIGSASIWGTAIDDKDPDIYLKTKAVLENVLPLISGGAGTGKTAGVDRVIYEMIGDEYEVVAVAPEDTQAENLANNINHKGQKYSINGLVEQMTKTEDNKTVNVKDYYIEKGNKWRIDREIPITKGDIFPEDGKKKIMFIDEYSLIDSPTLELISLWAKKNNVLVVPSGDSKQNAAALANSKGELEPSGVEDCHVLYLPELSVSLRAGSVAKLDNYNSLNSVLTLVRDYFTSNPEKKDGEISAYFLDHILPYNKIVFKYFNKDGNFDGGEKLVDKKDIDSYIEEISKKTDNYVVIHDGQAKYTNKGNDKHYIHRSKVQGIEYEYVIIDIDWGNGAGGKSRTLYQTLIDLYSLSQRSIKGSIIRNSGLGQLKIGNIEDESSSTILSMNLEQIEKYKEKRLKELSGIPENITLRSITPPVTIPTDEEEKKEKEGDDDGNEGGEDGESASPEDDFDDTNNPVIPEIPIPPIETLEEDPVISSTTEEDSAVEPTNSTESPGNNSGEKRNTKGRVYNGTKKSGVITTPGLRIEKTVETFSSYNPDINIVNKNSLKDSLWLLKSWILFGYYKTDKKGGILESEGRNVFSDDLKFDDNGIVSNISIGIKGDYIVATIHSDKDIIIPLLQKPDSIAAWDPEYEFEIWDSTSLEYDEQNGHATTWDGKQNYENEVKISDPYIFHVEDNKHMSSKQRNIDKDFMVRNEGRTVASICFDPFVSSDDEKNFWSTNEIDMYVRDEHGNPVKKGPTLWWTSDDKRFKLIGVNVHVKDMANLEDAVDIYDKGKLQNHNIVSNFTLHGILRAVLLRPGGDKKLLSLMQSFSDFRNERYGEYKCYAERYNNVGADEVYKKAVQIFTFDENNKINGLTESFINLIKGDKQDLHFIKEYEKDGVRQHFVKSTYWFVKALVKLYNNDGRIDDSFNVFNDDTFKAGLKINDFKKYSEQPNEKGNWYSIERKTSLPYTTNVPVPPLPIFRIIKKVVEQESPKQTEVERQDAEVQNEKSALERAIRNEILEAYKDYKNVKNWTFDIKGDVPGCKNGNYKIISLTLHKIEEGKQNDVICYVIVQEKDGEAKVLSNLDKSMLIYKLISLKSPFFRKLLVFDMYSRDENIDEYDKEAEDALNELVEDGVIEITDDNQSKDYTSELVGVIEDILKRINCN